MCQLIISGAGFVHAGSFLAEKMLNEDNNAALDVTLSRDFVTVLASRQHLKEKLFNLALLAAVI